MKTILCYGDSNTWGYDPADGSRFNRDVRWPGVLQAALGSDYYVVEEGLCGRTATWEDHSWDNRNGRTFLPLALESHAPLDMIIIMLGTNELKSAFNLSAVDVALGVGKLAQTVLALETDLPQVLLVAPAHVTSDVHAATPEFVGAEEKSLEVAGHLEKVARELGCYFFDAATVARVDPADGLHLSADAHTLLGRAMAAQVHDIFKDAL